VSSRYYTLAEVNQLVPELTRSFTRVLQLRGQLRTIYRRLEEKRFAPVGEDFEPAVPGAPADVVRDRTAFKALAATLRAELVAITETGCEIKDLEVGLVDWLGRSGKRDVYLCWRLGEPEVGWFHDLEAGFAGRRPISELEPPEGERAQA
jgi:hypothetical protein